MLQVLHYCIIAMSKIHNRIASDLKVKLTTYNIHTLIVNTIGGMQASFSVSMCYV